MSADACAVRAVLEDVQLGNERELVVCEALDIWTTLAFVKAETQRASHRRHRSVYSVP